MKQDYVDYLIQFINYLPFLKYSISILCYKFDSEYVNCIAKTYSFIFCTKYFDKIIYFRQIKLLKFYCVYYSIMI